MMVSKPSYETVSLAPSKYEDEIIYQNEYPPPSCVVSNPTHVADAPSQDSTKSTG